MSRKNQKYKSDNRVYKIRITHKYEGNNNRTYSIAIPPDIATLIPEGTTFTVELTQAGIIYIPVNGGTKQSWLDQENNK